MPLAPNSSRVAVVRFAAAHATEKRDYRSSWFWCIAIQLEYPPRRVVTPPSVVAGAKDTSWPFNCSAAVLNRSQPVICLSRYAIRVWSLVAWSFIGRIPFLLQFVMLTGRCGPEQLLSVCAWIERLVPVGLHAWQMLWYFFVKVPW